MSSRALLSRPPLERMLRIHEELRRGALVNCTKLVKALEVSRKTIVRDIAFMRDRLDLPIEYDVLIQAYRYTQPARPNALGRRAGQRTVPYLWAPNVTYIPLAFGIHRGVRPLPRNYGLSAGWGT